MDKAIIGKYYKDYKTALKELLTEQGIDNIAGYDKIKIII